MTRKLMRADVPMCPEPGCGGECRFDDGYHTCVVCGWCCGGSQEVPLGCYAPDVERVIAEMQKHLESPLCNGPYHDEIRRWIASLEGSHEQKNNQRR